MPNLKLPEGQECLRIGRIIIILCVSPLKNCSLVHALVVFLIFNNHNSLYILNVKAAQGISLVE